jgi:hypothetical protein
MTLVRLFSFFHLRREQRPPLAIKPWRIGGWMSDVDVLRELRVLLDELKTQLGFFPISRSQIVGFLGLLVAISTRSSVGCRAASLSL